MRHQAVPMARGDGRRAAAEGHARVGLRGKRCVGLCALRLRLVVWLTSPGQRVRRQWPYCSIGKHHIHSASGAMAALQHWGTSY